MGLGRRGGEHLETLAQLRDRYDLVAVCDVSEAVAQSTATAAGVKGYSDLKAFFDNEKLDVVVIATPRDTHHLVVNVAAAHRVHMLIETPLGQTRGMMDMICADVASAGVKAEVAENMWRRPSERLTRKVLDAGLIGKVLRTSSYHDDAGDNHCYHTMSRMQLYAGADVEEVQAYTRAYPGIVPRPDGRPPGDEHWTQALVSFSNGVLGSLTYVTEWTGPLRAGHPRFMSVEGTEGYVVTGLGSPNRLRRIEAGRAVDYPPQIETRRIGEHDVPVRFWYDTKPRVEVINPFGDRVLDHPRSRTGGLDGIARADELDSIYRAVTTNGEPSYSLARARRDQELSILITESARLNQPVSGHPEEDETVGEREGHEDFRKRRGFDPFDVDAFLAAR